MNKWLHLWWSCILKKFLLLRCWSWNLETSPIGDGDMLREIHIWGWHEYMCVLERWIWQQGGAWLESEARRRRLLWELQCKMMKDRSKAEKVGREKDQSWTALPLQVCLPKSNKFYSSVKSQFLPATPGSLPWFPGQTWVCLLCALTIPVLFTV